MGKGIRGGIIVGLAVLIAAIGYSTVYFQRGLLRFDQGGVSIILVLVWTLVVAVLLVVLWQRTLVREEYLRKIYISSESLFNFELGVLPAGDAVAAHDAGALVEQARALLSQLTYEESPVDPPEGFAPAICISSSRFSSADKDAGEWRGTVQRIQQRDDGRRTFVEVGSFENADELERTLDSVW